MNYLYVEDKTAESLIDKGYRRVSNKYRHVSRIDRSDWLEYLHKLGLAGTKGSLADHYRRVYSKDIIIVPLHIFKFIPSSCEGSYIFNKE